MNRRSWHELPLWLRELAVHEAAHGVISEALGWPVKYLRVRRDGSGFCGLRGEAPAPWVDVVVSAAGHAGEVWYRGGREPSVYGAYYDRRDGAKLLAAAGVDKHDGPFAVCEVERWLSLVFDHGGVGRAVKQVARLLARRRFLGRREFLESADLEFIDVRAVRRFCRRLALDVHHQHLEGTT